MYTGITHFQLTGVIQLFDNPHGHGVPEMLVLEEISIQFLNANA